MVGGPYRFISAQRQMGIGVAGSYLINISAVGKTNSKAVPYCVPNELICGTLGRIVGLPVPPCGIVEQKPSRGQAGKVWFATLDFNITGDSLPPVDVDAALHQLPVECAGILIFDIWVGNTDRHKKNFSVDLLANPPAMNVFDHSHALFGHRQGNAINRITQEMDRIGIAGHCLLHAIQTDSHFGKWIDRIQQVPDYMVDDICDHAAGTGIQQREVDEAKGFLKYRRDCIKNIIEQHKEEFRKISDWSLIT